MHHRQTIEAPKRTWQFLAAGVLLAVGVMASAVPAQAHELWMETDTSGERGREHEIHVCWGHAGDRETGRSLQSQQDKLAAWIRHPGGRPKTLGLAMGNDSFTTKVLPDDPGYHLLGAELQTGIIDRQLHDIPPSTRIVMYGKTFIYVDGSHGGVDTPLGMDLEIVPTGDFGNLAPGDVATVKVLLHGKPLGGRNVLVLLGTRGPERFADAAGALSRQWSIEDHPDPRTGEVHFPLIASGQHLFSIRYFNETPGRYDGDLDHRSEFSHLQKGDTYARTMYVSTFTVNVAPD